MLDIEFQYYPSNVKVPSPLGKVTLEYFINSHKNPVDKIKNAIDTIRVTDDTKKKNKLKKHLFYFTPSVVTDGEGRSYKNITEFTGLLVLEFDKVDDPEQLKEYVFKRLKSCICAYISPSGKGVKTLIKIPKCKNVEEYKEYFYGLAYYWEKYKGFDPSNQNPILPLFISYDTDFLFREDPETWTIKGEKINEFEEAEGKIKKVDKVSKKDKKIIKSYIITALSKIVDQGHPIVRSTSLVAGGYVGAGYFTIEEMQNFMFKELEKIDYLWKDMKGYKRTCVQMINLGSKSPIYL